MQLLSPADAASRVSAALKSAADATGAGFDYLMRTAQRESSMNPSAKAPTSSARGLFQFIDQTWLQVLKEDGPKLGLHAEAADVARLASGRYAVADPGRRAELLALRDDPKASALLAGAFTRRNAAVIEQQVGRTPTEGELYAAHFLGSQGAVELIKLASTQPQASAAAAFPAQASANRAMFFDQGRPRTAGEIYAKLTSGAAAPATGALSAQEVADDAALPAYNKGVEDDGRAFHSLFKTGRRSPVSAYVSQAWSSVGSLAADPNGPFRNLATAEPLNAARHSAPAAEPQAAEAPVVARKTRRTTVAVPAQTPGAPLDLAAFRRAVAETPVAIASRTARR